MMLDLISIDGLIQQMFLHKLVYKHLLVCGAREELSDERDLDILCSTLRGEVHLLTLEALWIRDIKPSINVKDEYRSRELTIKF